MRSRKISETAAQSLTSKIVKSLLGDEREAMKASIDTLAKDVCEYLKSLADAVEALPPGMRPGRPARIRFWKGGQGLTLDMPDTVYWNGDRYAGDVPDHIGDRDLANRIRSAITEAEELRRKEDAIGNDILRNIRTAGTTARLMEAWPEVKDIVLAYYDEVEFMDIPLDKIVERNIRALAAPQPKETNE